jgi:hypothetical protein
MLQCNETKTTEISKFNSVPGQFNWIFAIRQSLTGPNIYRNSVTSQVTCSCRLKFGTEYIEFRITDSVRSSRSNKENNFGTISATVILHTCACLKR